MKKENFLTNLWEKLQTCDYVRYKLIAVLNFFFTTINIFISGFCSPIFRDDRTSTMVFGVVMFLRSCLSIVEHTRWKKHEVVLGLVVLHFQHWLGCMIFLRMGVWWIAVLMVEYLLLAVITWKLSSRFRKFRRK